MPLLYVAQSVQQPGDSQVVPGFAFMPGAQALGSAGKFGVITPLFVQLRGVQANGTVGALRGVVKTPVVVQFTGVQTSSGAGAVEAASEVFIVYA